MLCRHTFQHIRQYPAALHVFNLGLRVQPQRKCYVFLAPIRTKYQQRDWLTRLGAVGESEHVELFCSIQAQRGDGNTRRQLARHYAFTEEELAFIINYDIKYRMGRDAGSDDE